MGDIPNQSTDTQEVSVLNTQAKLCLKSWGLPASIVDVSWFRAFVQVSMYTGLVNYRIHTKKELLWAPQSLVKSKI